MNSVSSPVNNTISCARCTNSITNGIIYNSQLYCSDDCRKSGVLPSEPYTHILQTPLIPPPPMFLSPQAPPIPPLPKFLSSQASLDPLDPLDPQASHVPQTLQTTQTTQTTRTPQTLKTKRYAGTCDYCSHVWKCNSMYVETEDAWYCNTLCKAKKEYKEPTVTITAVNHFLPLPSSTLVTVFPLRLHFRERHRYF